MAIRLASSGKYSLAQLDKCTPCDRILHTSPSLGAVCRACPRDTIAPNEGLSSCGKCNVTDGKFSSVDRTECRVCNAGQFTNRSGEQTTCNDCVPGRYQPGGQEACLDCPKGWYQDEGGRQFCLPCVQGEYNDVTGGVQCKQCAAGTASNTVRRGDAVACEVCQGGYYQWEKPRMSCLPCKAASTAKMPARVVPTAQRQNTERRV